MAALRYESRNKRPPMPQNYPSVSVDLDILVPREKAKEENGDVSMSTQWRDIRYGARMLGKRPELEVNEP
jgi:hypothetical protein